jgi:hypothetical protein
MNAAPDYPAAWNNLGNLFLHFGHPEDAITRFGHMVAAGSKTERATIEKGSPYEIMKIVWEMIYCQKTSQGSSLSWKVIRDLATKFTFRALWRRLENAVPKHDI